MIATALGLAMDPAVPDWLVAVWYDPAGNGIDTGDLLTLAGLITAAAGGAIATWRLMLRSLDKRIALIAGALDARTALIQSDANGGRSLPDVARTTDWTRAALKAIADAHGITLPPDLEPVRTARTRSTDRTDGRPQP